MVSPEGLARREAADLARDAQWRKEKEYVPPAPVKAKFPWTLFREVLDGDKTVDDLDTKLTDIPLPGEAFDAVSREGKTPLELAKESGNEELIELLERAGAKGGRRRLGLYVKRRGTKRHGRSRKHRKLRKLTSRRR